MSGLDIAAAGAAELVAKATLVLCLALALAWFARRESARTLHLLWTTAFVFLLALPALSLLGPSWSVRVLPVRDVETRGESVVMAVGEASARRTARRDTRLGDSTRIPAADGKLQGLTRLAHGSVERVPTPGKRHTRPDPLRHRLPDLGPGLWRRTHLSRGRGPPLPQAGARGGPGARCGVAAAGRRHSMATWRAERSPNPDEPEGGHADGGWSLEAGDPAAVRRGRLVAGAACSGVDPRTGPRPTPGRAPSGRRPHRGGALLVSTPSAGWRGGATIAGERSCDEGVLALGTRPSEYARHLFSLASGTADGRALLALPMVQRSQLENRIMSILKRHRPRYSLARTLAALTGMGVAGTLIACVNQFPEIRPRRPRPGNRR